MIWQHLAASFIRIMEGIFIALAVGMPAGLLLARSPKANRVGNPLLYLAYPVPKLALLPVVMLVFGIGEAAKIVMIVMILVFQITLAVRDAVLHIPPEDFDMLTSLGANRRQVLRWIVLPAIVPETLTSLRVATGTAISVLFFAETFGTDKGMGFFIVDAWMRLDYRSMALGITLLSLMGVALFGAIDWLERKVK